MSSVGRYDQKGLKWTGQSDRLLGPVEVAGLLGEQITNLS